MEHVHPHFNRARAEAFLERTDIRRDSQVRELSKGMITQLHLALIMAIDSKLLVLDEPTLGLDILYRKQFYRTLLDDYFDEQKTILITTHQVEEIENLLTHVVFIKNGKLCLQAEMNDLEHRYTELHVDQEQVLSAQALNPIHTRPILGGKAMIFEGVTRTQLAALGVEMIEQPFAPGEDQLLAEVERLIPVTADESCQDRRDLAGLVGRYDLVNIKLDKAGGLTEALALTRQARALGFDIMVGCNVGTSLAMAPALLLAQGARFVDIDGPLLLSEDRPDAMRYQDSQAYPADRALWG